MIEGSTLGFNVLDCRLIRTVDPSTARGTGSTGDSLRLPRRCRAAANCCNDRLFLETRHQSFGDYCRGASVNGTTCGRVRTVEQDSHLRATHLRDALSRSIHRPYLVRMFDFTVVRTTMSCVFRSANYE